MLNRVTSRSAFGPPWSSAIWVRHHSAAFYSVPSGVGVRADHAVLRPATNRTAVLLIETDSKSLIGPIGFALSTASPSCIAGRLGCLELDARNEVGVR